MNKIRFFIGAALALCFCSAAYAGDDDQTFNPIATGVPSLTIAPDARGAGMGDLGVATDPDVNSQYWNPAKYAFAYSKAGASFTYTPWLSTLVDDIGLMYLTGYYKLGDYDRQAISASLRYFSLGNITITDNTGLPVTDVSPMELALDLGYSLKFSETFSGAATFRYIYSDMGTIDDTYDPGTTFAADIAGYYSNYVMLGNSECLLGLGFNASNIGPKISYDKGQSYSFLPTMLRIGGSLLYPLDDYNTLSFNLDASKYMVPTPPNVSRDDPNRETHWNEYRDTPTISGIFKSFSDAPGGFKEELEEIMWSVGAEYAYDNQFFVRGGYYHESPNKGNRQYFTFGAGFKLTAFQLDVSYLVSTVPSNPLDKTLRVSLSFDMDGLKELVR